MNNKKPSMKDLAILCLAWGALLAMLFEIPLHARPPENSKPSPKETDVLLILDGTKSQKRYVSQINRVLAAIAAFPQKTPSRENLSLHAGIFLYRDQMISCTGILEFETLYPLGEIPPAGIEPLNESIFKSCDNDNPESVYRGLYLGAGETPFRQGSHKVIIHIGDAGDHGRYESIDQVKDMLVKKQIDYYAVNLDPLSGFRAGTEPLAKALDRERPARYYDSIDEFLQQLDPVLTGPIAGTLGMGKENTPGPEPVSQPVKEEEPLNREAVKNAGKESLNYLDHILIFLGMQGVESYLRRHPFPGNFASIAFILLLALIGYFLSKKILVPLLNFFSKQILRRWGRCFVEKGLFNVLDYYIPGAIVYLALSAFPRAAGTGRKIIEAFFISMFTILVSRFIGSFASIYREWEAAKKFPIHAYLQVMNIFVYIVGTVFMVSHLIDRSPLILLAWLGAIGAAIVFVFNTTVLSFVANIQINSTQMIKLGDRISMPQFNVDGLVLDISLNSIILKNNDDTIAYIPTHKILEEPFINRGPN